MIKSLVVTVSGPLIIQFCLPSASVRLRLSYIMRHDGNLPILAAGDTALLVILDIDLHNL